MIRIPCVLDRIISVEALYTAFEIPFTLSGGEGGEAHNFWEILCVLEGEVSAATERAVHLLHPGEVIFHRPMEFHRHRAAEGIPSRILVLSFDAGRMPPLDHFVFSLTGALISRLRALVARIGATLRTERYAVLGVPEGAALAAQSLLSEFEELLADILSGAVAEAGVSLSPEADTFRRAVTYLHDRLTLSLSAPEVARALNISLSSLKRLFSRYAGIGVMTYFQKLKIARAAELLGAGASVGETAAALAFASAPAFCTAFRRMMGIPPSEYKRRRAEK